MKVWIVTKEYGYDRKIIEIFDSKDKAIKYVKNEFKFGDREYNTEDLKVQITYSFPYEPSTPDYIIDEWEVK